MDKSIKVLHVLGGLDLGGAETFVMSLYRAINRDKVNFDFVVHSQKQFYYEKEIAGMGGQIFRVPKFNGINIVSYIKAWIKFFKANGNYVAVHGHIGSSAAIYLYIAKKYKIKTIAHSHGSKNEFTLKGFMYSIFSYPTRFIADYFFACSELAGKTRFGKNVLKLPNFMLIPNAIDLDKFHFKEEVRLETRKSLNITDDFVIGHIGRLDPIKNQKFLIKILAEIKDKVENVKLLIVGEGEERKNLEQEIEKYELSQYVLMVGSRSDIPQLLSAMDVFVLPSFSEGFGIVLIEAQSTGLRCLVSSKVPAEAKLTNLVEFISLKDPSDKWINSILNSTDYIRRNRVEDLKRAGYDTKLSSEKIEQFYAQFK